MESDLPWIPGAIIAYLRLDAGFLEACHDQVSTRAGGTVTTPHATVQMSAPGADLGGGVFRQVVQVDGWCPHSWSEEDPEAVVWRIASRAHQRLYRARNVPYESMHYSVRPFEFGPLPPDTSRGEATPLYRAVVRAQVTVHNR